MVGHELTVEQGETGETQPRRQPGQRHLRRVRAPRHHAFAEKGSAQRDAIKAADQFLPVPDLHRMGKADLVQMAIGLFDLAIDPGGRAIVRGLRAEPHDAREIPVGGHAEPVAADRLGQRMGQMEAIEWKDGTPLGLDPVDVLRFPVVRHRKHADGIGLQQHQRIDRHHPRT